MSTRNIATSTQSLSTGNRINNAADDAAGLAISTRMTSQIRGTAQALRNVLDAQSLVAVADGAYQSIGSELQRMRELAVAAANGSMTDTDRAALDLELNALVADVDSIATNTQWNGQGLLDGSMGELTFQASANSTNNDSLSLTVLSPTTENLGLGTIPEQDAIPQIGGDAQPVTLAAVSGVTVNNPLISLATTSWAAGVNVTAGIKTSANGNTISPTAPLPDLQATSTASEFQVSDATYVRIPSSATSQSGDTVVVWSETDGTFARVYDQQGSPVGERKLITTIGNILPDVTALDNGDFLVTYDMHYDGGIFCQRLDSTGTNIGNSFRVGTGPGAAPTCTQLEGGNIVVTWSVGDQYQTVFGQLFDSSGNAIGNEISLSSDSQRTQIDSQVTSLSDGGFVVTYSSRDSYSDLLAQRFDATGAKVGAELQVNTYTINNQDSPAITSFGDGSFVVVWHSYGQDGYRGGIYGQLFDTNGFPSGQEFQISSALDAEQEQPDVTVLSDGSFIVTWSSLRVDQDTGLWVSSGRDIYAQHFDQTGNKIGTEFQVNSYSTASEGNPSITALNNGGFYVNWISYDSQSNIFGRFFDANLNPIEIGSYTLPVTTTIEGKTVGLDVGRNYNGTTWDYFGVASDIADAINADSDLQAAGYSAVAATAAQVGSGSYSAGDVILTRNVLTSTNVSFTVEAETITVDLSAYATDLFGAAGEVANAINSNTTLQGLDYSAVAATQAQVAAGLYNAGDVIVSRADTPITQVAVAAQPARAGVSLATQADAQTTINAMDVALDTLSSHLAGLGAFSNRLTHAADNLINANANNLAARSRVLDTDYADETTRLARELIINNAATAMLSQANVSYQDVLVLIDQYR